MRRMRRLFLFAMVVIVSCSLWGGDEKQSAATPLDAIQWIVGDWHGTAKAPDGTVLEVDNHIYWGETHTAIFFLSRFNGKPHYSGMYAYDTEHKQIGFWYVDSNGGFTHGTATPDGKRLIQVFSVIGADGKMQPLRSYLDRSADDSAYHFQVLRDGEAKPLIELDYTRKR